MEDSARDDVINNLSLSKQDVQKINDLYKDIVSKNYNLPQSSDQQRSGFIDKPPLHKKMLPHLKGIKSPYINQ